MPTEFIGVGALRKGLDYLRAERFTLPFIVASEGTMARQRKNLGEFADGRLFSDFSPNPSWTEIEKGCEFCRRISPDLIMAIGGGSAIDVAKTIKAVVYADNRFEPDTPNLLAVSGKGPVLAALPTTAGSGSESTHFSVYYRGQTKHSLAHSFIRPDVVVVDPSLSAAMPPSLTATTGFDALSQAVESIWAKGGNDDSRRFARLAIKLVLPNLVAAVTAPNPENRLSMAEGAFFAGRAIDIGKTTAPHALSYYLTKKYAIPHGHAVALMMPYFFVVNAYPAGVCFTGEPPKEIASAMLEVFDLLGVKTLEECILLWRDLLSQCGLARGLHDIGICSANEFRDIVSAVNVERLNNNPVRFSPERLVDLLLGYSLRE